ncbi:abortive infection protein [Catenovulum agarivorans DS-2]|uniref:Abortive infection protein n=1 Tax=Catenovulum agarivorans DS-2 TaxID=1328313 RepID=W7QLF3_9ALTE|nr:CPBP family intramembrane glutamic endopeptidase [Catenovulum agarivorans]EWH09762.1 abortive infection protein [Catenovulum agarivorans DS-2]
MEMVFSKYKTQAIFASLILVVLLAVFGNFIQAKAAIFSVAFITFCGWLPNKPWQKTSQIILLTVASVGLILHLVPGFNNILIWQDRLFSDSSVPHTFYINFDKALVAIALLFYLFRQRGLHEKARQTTRHLLTVAAATLVVTFASALLFGVINWDFKLPDNILLFGLSMVFITVTAEECLFRGVLQRSFSHKIGVWGVPIIAVLFGLAHLPFSTGFAICATIASLGYGYVYYKSGQIIWPVMLHSAVNFTHLFLFSYPLLQ